MDDLDSTFDAILSKGGVSYNSLDFFRSHVSHIANKADLNVTSDLMKEAWSNLTDDEKQRVQTMVQKINKSWK